MNYLAIPNDDSNSLGCQTGHRIDIDGQLPLLAMCTINLRANS